MGMANLDFVLGGIFLLCFIYGTLCGFLFQLVALAALLIGLGAAWLITSIPGVLFPSRIIIPPFPGAVIGIVVFFLFYFITRRLGRRLIHAKALAFSNGPVDRMMGGVFSLVKGVVVVLLVIWFLDCIQADWRQAHPRAQELWGRSTGVRWAHCHNPITGLAPMRRLEGFFAAAQNPDARGALHGQPAYARMLANVNFRAVRDDAEIIKALGRGDWMALLGNARVRALLADGAFWSDLSSVKWEMALKKGKPQSEVHWPSLAPAPVLPELPVENRAEAGRPAPSRIVLKSGAVIKGVIKKEEPDAITLDIFVSGGVITLSVGRAEIERIESAHPGRPH